MSWFNKSNNKSKRGFSRDQETTGGTGTTTYSGDQAANRRLNSRVNDRHARLPKSWLRKSECED